ncbi:arsenate reductase ArsC [Dietzia sp. DQ12-76]|nr:MULTISPECIES: phosphatase [unclassified Dietzia]AVZ41326.1 phosphatase [Dietzia sp. JS16-p6b]MBB1023463.1 arsenate reductase ArsC [Dietzia sp. DQ12-76]MBB1028253.1 arsenate reductase ArsC [Dietzia sp. DQ11-38-2]QGW26140.1 putative arsenate reductase [Dietzia sp. DQ12-45-1b]
MSRSVHDAPLPELLMPQTQLQRDARELARHYEGVFSPQTVERVVFESYASLRRTARVTAHLPSIARRFATDRLKALAQADGAVAKDVPEVLFICVQNSGRSQMAAALMAHRSEGRVHVRSAGSLPGSGIDENCAAVMAEMGLDLGKEYPKPLTDDVVAAADVVISMGCGDACAVYPGKRYLDWDVSDPAGQDLDRVRSIRDDIDSRVRRALPEIVATTRSPASGLTGSHGADKVVGAS